MEPNHWDSSHIDGSADSNGSRRMCPGIHFCNGMLPKSPQSKVKLPYAKTGTACLSIAIQNRQLERNFAFRLEMKTL
ncbi:MAG TPA: hypothetical protein DD473_04365 [Planctomycetaceae bacterium]|nr:hypothetical protein [Planctomycetaceae bacterium]